MKDFIGSASSSIIVFIVTLCLDVAVGQYDAEKGTYQQSKIMIDSNSAEAVLRISNHSRKELKDIKLLVPKALNLDDIKTSLPVAISFTQETVSNPAQRVLLISLIPANKTVTLLVSLNKENECCYLFNGREVGLDILDADYSPDTLYESLKEGALMAALYTLFFLGYSLYVKRLYLKMEEKNSTHVESVKRELMEEQRKISDELSEMERKAAISGREVSEKAAEIIHLRKMHEYLKARTVKKLADHSKELEFWRNTVRKILYQEGHQRTSVEKIIFSVTNDLHTYTTRENVAGNYNTLKALAELMEDENTKAEK